MYHGPNRRSFNKLYRRDDIDIFDLNYKDFDDNGMVTGLDQKTVYINVHKWIKHLEALMLAKLYYKLIIIKSAYLGL